MAPFPECLSAVMSAVMSADASADAQARINIRYDQPIILGRYGWPII